VGYLEIWLAQRTHSERITPPKTQNPNATNNRRRRSPDGKRWTAERAQLPMAGMREGLAEALAAADVVVVSGETGSGKTTQVRGWGWGWGWGWGKGVGVF